MNDLSAFDKRSKRRMICDLGKRDPPNVAKYIFLKAVENDSKRVKIPLIELIILINNDDQKLHHAVCMLT